MCATAVRTLDTLSNFTDLWWAFPAGSESGWGINLTHEGTTIFASWFTYDTSGKPMWLVATATQASAKSYSRERFYLHHRAPVQLGASSTRRRAWPRPPWAA